MRRLLTTSLLLHICCIVLAQVPQTLSSAEIYQGIKKLNVLGSVLYIAAHPDDENTRLLAYLSKEKQYRTGYLSLTRGDGGQNLIGDEQGIELGLIRTQELLAARRIDGAEQFFSRAFDFGFSKTADETLSIWGKEKILSDVVWVIRKFQPDVIITRFPGDSRAGHGHHWSSALLANEAFTAAADPNRFPEQFQYGVKPWQAKRILWNAFLFSTNSVPDSAFKIDVGAFNSLLGKGYGEIASESRSNHKSQGFGAARTRGEAFEYFITTGGDQPEQNLFDDVNTSWSRINHPDIQQQILQIQKDFSFEQPYNSVTSLVELYRSLKKLPDGYWKKQKLKETQQLIESAAGLFADATANTATAVQGDSLKITLQLNMRSAANVFAGKAYVSVLSNPEGYKALAEKPINAALPVNKNQSFPIAVSVPANTMISQPYWLREGEPNGSFKVSNQTDIGKAENSPAFEIHCSVNIEGEDFDIIRPLQYRFTDPVKGEVYQPVVVLPAWEENFSKHIYLSENGKPLFVAVQLKANTKADGSFQENVTPQVTKDWTMQPKTAKVSLNKDAIFELALEKKEVNNKGTISLPQISGNVYHGSSKTIAYNHIPNITYFSPAKSTLVNLDIKIVRKNIGYIPGAGDKVAEALQSLGYHVTVLSQEDIKPEVLKSFDAVITGIRAYNIHLYLTEKYDVLMNYVQNGGNLIVQYNTNNGVGPLRAKIGPYSFNVSRTRVTEEDAAVTFALPNNSVFNYPNKITASDFEGWVQERSVYEADQLDPAFVTPIQMNDKGEKPGKGSLIIAKYGKGNFVYTGLSFFRQLPAGVTGAYRLFANLIALPENK